MPLSADQLLPPLKSILAGDADTAKLALVDYLHAIPTLDSLDKLPRGTAVLVRGDVDCTPGPTVGDGDIRLRSMVETLQYGRDRGWIQVVCGHIGRKPDFTLDKVAGRLGELLGCDVPLVNDWLDPDTVTIREAAANAIKSAAPGAVFVLQNTRQYAVERLLWDATPESLPNVVGPLAKFANELASKIAKVYVNEAFSAGSLDSSSVAVPLAMDRAVLGKYVAGQFLGPMVRCLEAELVVFSGLKADKLDDLEAIINRGRVRWVFAAGSLAMALKKASAELGRSSFCMGVAENPEHAALPYFIPQARIEQARRMLERGKKQGVQFVLPIDFVLKDGRTVDVMTVNDQQLDIGPKSSALFAAKIGEFLATTTGRRAVAFHNGVFGYFEDPKFATGTKEFIPQLKRLTDGGVEVYVGGGEGGTALEKYGQPNWITHCFTAGGTVLNALGSNPVPYLVALRLANRK